MNNYVGGGYLLAPPTSGIAGYASRMYNTDDDQEALDDLVISAEILPANAIMLNVFSGSRSCISDTTGYAMPGDLETALVLGYRSNQPFKCDLWPECPCRFSKRKSLYRHMRMKHLHGVDILKRHIQSQHEEKASQVLCVVCNKHVRPRSLPAHRLGTKHKNAQHVAAQYVAAEIRHATIEYLRAFAERAPTPNCLDAIADPVQLIAWAFVKFNPWGTQNNRWINFAEPPNPPIKVSKEYTALKATVYNKLLNLLASGNALSDKALPDALSILTVLDAMTDGFEAGVRHCRAQVRLKCSQIFSPADAERWVQEEPSAEAFDTATSRGISEGSRQSSRHVIRLLLKLMRRAAVDIIYMPFQDQGVSVWNRFDSLTHAQWAGHYEPQLREIESLAHAIPGE
ncbi:uncharacterized protein RHO25_010742 [Cercospora beticola]|uniref:C2H2-type domain-containing protein n=1 Tax=Cercospora beticola TaxID=122368 RepID=A0ABZ0P2R6_CERBT|nr:hypothetical protein RHO25_010742 [Cercospora beticola]